MDDHDNHPVIQAIDSEVERLQDVRSQLLGEAAQVNREEEALEEARAALIVAMEQDDAPAPEPRPEKDSPLRLPPADVDSESVLAKVAELGGSVRNADIRRPFKLSETRAREILTALVSAGKLERIGRNNGTRYRLPDRSDSNGGGAEPAALPSAEVVVDFVAKQGGKVSSKVLREEFKLAEDEVRRALAGPLEAGELVATDVGAGTRYGLPEKVKGTPEGRICSALNYSHMTAEELAEHLDEPTNFLLPHLGKLMREGDVRSVKANGRVLYRFVGAA